MLNILKGKFETSGRYTPRYIAEEKKIRNFNIDILSCYYMFAEEARPLVK